MDLAIFISYSHADRPLARAIASGLRERGVRVWIDEGELRIGDSLIERISSAIDDVHFVLALISAHSVASQWCKKEIALAMTDGLRRKGVKVLPLRVGDTQMPPALADALYLQISDKDLEAMLDRIVHDAASHRRESQMAEAASASVESANEAERVPDDLAATIDAMLANETHFPPVSRERLRARVKWFNSEKGFGFLETPDGTDYFVHYAWIISPSYRYLIEGERVTFTPGRGTRGPAALAIVPDTPEPRRERGR